MLGPSLPLRRQYQTLRNPAVVEYSEVQRRSGWICASRARRDGGLGEAGEDRLSLPGIIHHVADREDAGLLVTAVAGSVTIWLRLERQAPVGDRPPSDIDSPKNGSSTSASIFFAAAIERGDGHRLQLPMRRRGLS